MLQEEFKKAKTYAAMFIIAALWVIIALWNLYLGIKMGIMLTYYILINRFLIKGGVIRRIIWNFIYSFSGAAILCVLNKSWAAIALAILSQENIMKEITIGEVFKFVPEAWIWATISVAYASLAGIIRVVQLDEFKEAIISSIHDLKFK